jgi:uncharacterized protein YjbI with pentapeptide repeats
LSDADLRRADLRRADLRRADLRRADLRRADLSDADLSDADLRRADLRRADLRRADLSDADLSAADLSAADLRRADLRRADLSDADLRRADLRRADLSDAVLSDVPVVENLHRKILQAIEGDGALEMSQWHTCETTHCRAGWAIHLAGAAGYKLEKEVGASVAGALISLRSCPFLERVPNFYATNEAALEDIRNCAAKEAAA